MQSRLSQQSLQQQQQHRHSSSSASAASGLTSPTMAATEVITFRRRYQPDSVNASKPATPLSPALMARRKSANLSGGDSPASSASARLRSPKVTPASTSSASSSRSDLALGTAAGGSKPKLKSKSNLSSFNRTAASSFAPLQRRVSEPHSPYASPRLANNPNVNPFDSSFTTSSDKDLTVGRRVSTSSYSLRRPSLSSSITAPPTTGQPGSSTRPQDYAGFAGFLAAVYSEPTVTPDPSDSGYDGHDERDRRVQINDKPSNSNQAPKAASLRDKLVSLVSSSASSSSSSSDSSSSGARRPTRFMFGRGAAASGTRSSSASKKTSLATADEAAGSSDDEGAGQSVPSQSTVGSTATVRKTTAATAPPATKDSQYIVSVLPTKRQPSRSTPTAQPGMPRRGTGDSALATSSSSSESDEEKRAREPTPQDDGEERGRTSRKPSERVVRVSVLDRVAENARVYGAAAADDGGRGRSKQRGSAASMRRSVSPNRSVSRASSRDPRRLIAVRA